MMRRGIDLSRFKLVLILLLTTVGLLVFSSAGLASEDLSNVITVNGNGIVKVSPNMADLSFAVVTEAADAGTATTQNAKMVNKVIEALKNSGIPQADITTAGYNLYPKYIYEENKSPRISGYEVRNEILVTVRDVANVGNTIDVAVKSGINQVQNIRFYVEGNMDQKIKALRQAIEDARSKAEVIAAALGKKIAGVKSATGDWYNDGPQPIILEKRMAAGAGGAMDTPINPGMVEIRATAQIVYLIQ